MPATKVIVNIPGEEAYDVRIGGGVLANLGAHLRKLPVFAESDRCPNCRTTLMWKTGAIFRLPYNISVAVTAA